MRRTIRSRRSLAAVLGTAVLLATGAANAEPPGLPLGLDKATLAIPADNPITPEKVALGKQLFFDPRWSRSKTVSCASCHLPEHGWADPRRVSVRADGKPTPRHSPSCSTPKKARQPFANCAVGNR